jgi:cytochrome c peroxidase
LSFKQEDIGIDDFQAKRSPDGRYRTAPLRALWDMKQIHKGGFYHDGRFATLNEVVNHYDNHFALRSKTFGPATASARVQPVRYSYSPSIPLPV